MDGVAGPRLRDAGLGLGVSRSFGPAGWACWKRPEKRRQNPDAKYNYLHFLGLDLGGLNCLGGRKLPVNDVKPRCYLCIIPTFFRLKLYVFFVGIVYLIHGVSVYGLDVTSRRGVKDQLQMRETVSLSAGRYFQKLEEVFPL